MLNTAEHVGQRPSAPDCEVRASSTEAHRLHEKLNLLSGGVGGTVLGRGGSLDARFMETPAVEVDAAAPAKRRGTADESDDSGKASGCGSYNKGYRTLHVVSSQRHRPFPASSAAMVFPQINDSLERAATDGYNIDGAVIGHCRRFSTSRQRKWYSSCTRQKNRNSDKKR